MDLHEMNEQGKYILEETSSNGYWVASPKDKIKDVWTCIQPKITSVRRIKKIYFQGTRK